MHRPAAGDVDLQLGRAVDEAPQLISHVDRVKRALAAADFDAASAALPALSRAVEDADLGERASRSAERGVREIEDALSREAYWRAPVWKRAAAIAAGPAANLLVAIVLFAGLFMAGGGKATQNIGQVMPDSAAAQAGLQPGDRIVEIAGDPVSADEISARIRESQGKPITIVVERGDSRTEIGPVRARQDEDGDYRLGFVLRGEGLSPAESVWQSVRLTGIVTREIGVSLGRLVRGQGRDQIASPVGITQASSDALERGVQEYFWVLGLISLSLALLNLLPLLPLDGGHILFSLIEGLRGKAVRREVYERVSAIGLALVLLLFFIGLSNDIGRLS
jgi:regulator of sigma E protease